MQPVKLGGWPWCLTAALLLSLTVSTASSTAQTVLGTPEQTNERIKALSSAARVTPHDYVIGSGDTLTIEVFDVKEFSRDVRVSQTGTIGLPLLPVRLQVKGLTETQAEQKIAEVLIANGLVSHPEVTVSVKDRKSKPVTVVGAVIHPLVFQADRPVTLLEVLAEAGGIANDAGDTAIVTRPTDQATRDTYGYGTPAEPNPNSNNDDVIPPAGQDNSSATINPSQPVAGVAPSAPALENKTVFPEGRTAQIAATPDAPVPREAPALSNTITVNLNELMESGNATNNIILQAGDIVTVPHAGIVYVLGSVGRPGGFVLANDRAHMTTLKMLALAGGLNRTAKSAKAVIIRKDNQGQQHELNVDLKKVEERKAEDIQLQASDILYVPDSIAKRALIKAGEITLGVGTGLVLYRVGLH